MSLLCITCCTLQRLSTPWCCVAITWNATTITNREAKGSGARGVGMMKHHCHPPLKLFKPLRFGRRFNMFGRFKKRASMGSNLNLLFSFLIFYNLLNLEMFKSSLKPIRTYHILNPKVHLQLLMKHWQTIAHLVDYSLMNSHPLTPCHISTLIIEGNEHYVRAINTPNGVWSWITMKPLIVLTFELVFTNN